MTDIAPDAGGRPPSIPFWRDSRVLGVLAQIAFFTLVVAGLVGLGRNVAGNMGRLGENQLLCRDGSSNFRCAFDFLRLDAQFEIAETVIPYDPSDSYGRALLAGALNTAKVGFFGIILATILGTATGIARLSSNWLIRTIARWYVDLIRNTPLLLQLFFLFFGVILLLPSIRQAAQPFGLPIFLSQRGINLPGVALMPSFTLWLALIGVGLLAAGVVWWLLGRRERRLGRDTRRSLWALLMLLLFAVPGWFVAAAAGAGNQGFVVAADAGIATPADVAARARAALGVDDLSAVEAAVAAGELTPEQVEAATVTLCTVEGAPAEANAAAWLRRAAVPYDVERAPGPNEAIRAYLDGDCRLLVLSRAALTAAAIPNSAIVPLPETPLRLDVPRIEGLNFVGGLKLSPNFAAILIGLVIYTGAFIAEIVRAGILSVPKGQSEAARALGLSEGQRLRLVVLPQALRVIIPPLTSQYLNLTKNSSLAAAVGYPDLWSISTVIINQTGRAVEMIAVVMGIYLTTSLLTSIFMNWYNNKVRLIER